MAQAVRKPQKRSSVKDLTPATTPVTKKPKLDSPAASSPAPSVPAGPLLPSRILEYRPLPTLADPQPESLPAEDYQSIASSAVLQASLDRSRSKWTLDGILERYWTKPESGKHAKPPPPNNPDAKSMKLKGPCRIRVEPHIFEAELYLDEKEKVKPTPQPKQYLNPANNAPRQPFHMIPPTHLQQQTPRPQHPQAQPSSSHVLPYTPQSTQPPRPYQQPVVNGQAAPRPQGPAVQTPAHTPSTQTPVQTPGTHTQAQTPSTHPPAATAHTQPPTQPSSQTVQAPSRPPSAQSTQPQAKTGAAQSPSSQTPNQTPSQTPRPPATQPPAKSKASPDPVISMLAARASSDPELKTLMKEVATGKASQEQLRVFQRHIDELTKLIQERERAKGSAPALPAVGTPVPPQRPASIPNPPPPTTIQPQPTQQYRPQPTTYQQPQAWQPPPPPVLPVVLQFTTPGSSENRFLFPRYSILENLTQQHLLVSFIVTKRGRDAVDPTGLISDKEYWQPVTLMVEVAYGREELLQCVRRWVKPAEEVRKHMEEVMTRCSRAPVAHLAFQLPHKASGIAEAEVISRPETPTVTPLEKPRAKPRSNVVFVKKKPVPSPAAPAPSSEKRGGGKKDATPVAKSGTEATKAGEAKAAATETPVEGRRSTRRTLRNSTTD